MAVDSASHIGNFDATKPDGSEAAAELDNNIRHVKTVLRTDFQYVTGPVTATHTELSYVSGVTSAIQTQLDAKGAKAGQTWTGAHDFSGASSVLLPTATVGDSTNKGASTAFVATAIAAVNAQTGMSNSRTAATSFSVTAGQRVACTAATAWTATYPTSPTLGDTCVVCSQNGLATNAIDFGPNGAIGANGTVVTGVMTMDQVKPSYPWTWFGDYWREA